MDVRLRGFCAPPPQQLRLKKLNAIFNLNCWPNGVCYASSNSLVFPPLLSGELTALWRCGGPPAGIARLGSDSSTEGSCHRVNRIKLIHQRLAEADGLPAVLSVSWEIFELVGTIASASAGKSPDMYPAFTFARGAAVSGRNAIAFAPSMPPVSGETGHRPLKLVQDVGEIADALADLASAMSIRLRESAGLAAADGDRSACENAAGEAERIAWFLAKRTS